MEQSPREANRFSANQENSRILWNPKVHYLIHKCPPPVPFLSQLDPVHTPHATSSRPIVILPSHLRMGLPSGLFPSGFPTKTLYTPLLSPIRATCPVHLILLDFITRTILGEEYRKWDYIYKLPQARFIHKKEMNCFPISIVKPTRCTISQIYFILEQHSTCFGRSLHPSSGV